MWVEETGWTGRREVGSSDCSQSVEQVRYHLVSVGRESSRDIRTTESPPPLRFAWRGKTASSTQRILTSTKHQNICTSHSNRVRTGAKSGAVEERAGSDGGDGCSLSLGRNGKTNVGSLSNMSLSSTFPPVWTVSVVLQPPRSDCTTSRASRSLHPKRRGRGELGRRHSPQGVGHGPRTGGSPTVSLHSSIEHAAWPSDGRYLGIDRSSRPITKIYVILYMSDVPLSESGQEIRGKPRTGAGRSGWDC